ncbi:PAS domain S-box-containing protein/diguanylate cyclase (GGDEF) domain-containing protein [Paraburkholderia steynii]|uniref:diguanylate cyclase n=1 Tax=Paraburkholderia steynii TaxID=1245441 RepID=A0A7Z7BMA9_9BURK|nr:GGDEF domain-containing protein [Paraburkholderia steynii]SDJ58052.1 PAS domain S-box-containing protein/diguanylate cyclase (GGDEF) domain-containing protein [Paraburkholderia steynii]
MDNPAAHRSPSLQAASLSPSVTAKLADVWHLLLALMVTTLTCLASGALKTMAGEIAPIWLTNAVLLSQLMAAPRRQRYWVFVGGVLGNLAANLYVGESLAVSASYSSADIVEVLIAFAFAPSVSSVAELVRLKPLVRFVTGGVLLAPAVCGVLATTLLRGELTGQALLNLANWYVSDALSLAIFTPATLVFWTGEVAHLLRADQLRKTAFLLLLVCIVTTGVFGQSRFPLLYWALPPIVLLAFQADLAGVLVGLLLCLAIAVSFTMRGSGPLWVFPYETMQGRIFGLQLFLVAALGIALPISATQAQRSRLFTMLRDGERRYRLLAENATDVVMSLGRDGRLTYVSPRITALLGHPPDQLIGTSLSDLALSGDRSALAAVLEKVASGESEASQASRFLHRNGGAIWMETHLRCVIDPFSGKPDSLTATVRNISEQKLAEQRAADERAELQGLVFRDGLTGLFNRRHFDRELGRHWQQQSRADKRGNLAVIMADVDAYKSFNDCYGHQRGDECLRTVAAAISSTASRATDTVARYGGEEFALILPDTDGEGALIVAERIRRAVECLGISHEASSPGIVTISVGVAATQAGQDSDPAMLVGAADRALYAAKRQGRNCICVADVDEQEPTGSEIRVKRG